MAGSKIKGISIKIGADTMGLDKALNGIEAKSKSAKDELRQIDKTIKNAPDSLTAWKQKQEVLNKAISDSKDKVKLLENAQEQVAKQLADGKISGEQYRAFERELENARSETSKLESQLVGTTQQVRNLEHGVNSSTDTVRNASDGYTVFKDVLANLATQGINFAFDKLKIFTQQIIETGKTFEASLSNVQAISGATGDEIGVLSEKAKQMGATTKYTASQAADAFGYMALAGWKTQDMLAGIDGVLNLAAGSNMDLALASDIVTDYLTAFGLTAQDSGHFVDMMSYAMSRSNTTTELLGEAYKNCAATAASMGYSAEETTAVLMTMANAGVKGGEAGTALNAIMTRLATDTKECASELEKYDVHVYDTEGSMNSLSSILQGVSGVWTTLTDQQQANLAKMIAGTNHYSALQTIMNGLSDSAKASGMSFTDYAAALEECDGTAQNMANTMIDNLAGDMTILDSAIDGVKLALADKLNPILRDLVQYITEKMPEIQKSSEKALDTVVIIAEWCRKNMPEIKKKFSDLIPVISGVASGFVALETAKTTTKAVKGLVDVVKLLNAAMLANPATVAVAGIAALVATIGACVVQAETDVSKLQEISNDVAEEFADKTKAIDDIKEKIDDLNGSFYNSAGAIDDEFDSVKDLWRELDNLTYANGKVLDADKKRAGYILGELNEALGTEYSMTGNQIDNYEKLSGEIDKIIEKKKAEALLDAALATSSELLIQQEELKQQHRIAVEDENNTKAEWDKAKENYKAIEEETGLSSSQFVNQYGSLFDKGAKSTHHEYVDENGDFAHKIITKEQYQAAVDVETANQRYQNALANRKSSGEEWQAVSEQVKTIFDSKAAYDSGEYKKSIELSLGDYSGFNIETATTNEMLEEYERQKNNLASDWKLFSKSQNQSEINDFLNDFVSNLDLGQKAGVKDITSSENFDIIRSIVDKDMDLSIFTEFGKDSGIDITDFLGNNISEIFSEQVEKGYNVDDLLEWVGNSDRKIAEKSWEDFRTYVDNEIKNNSEYDITPILKTAEKAGINVGEAFGSKYTKLVQEQINRGHDPTELLKWWAETDRKAADDFKENYMDITQTMLDNGLDPTAFLADTAEKDKKFAESFKKNSVDVIQAMLDKGFNPTSLIQWFMDNGVKFGDVMSSEVRIQFEEMLSGRFDTTKFFEWLSNLGAESGDVWGKNFQDAVNQYLYQQEVKAGETKPNSAWDAALYEGKVNWNDYYPSYRFTKYATGGYISSGNRAIVAEAGPELLEVMNGGIRVTPLTDNAHSTSASDSGTSQKIFYNTYNINNPRIASNMDISTIAQKIATEQKRIEVGRGLK